MARVPFLMRVKEKHDYSFYHITSVEEFVRVAYMLLKERYDLGYNYPSVAQAEKEVEEDIKRLRNNFNSDLLELTSEEVESLPESLREKALAQRVEFAARADSVRQRAEKIGDLWFARNLERVMQLPPLEAIADTIQWRNKEVNTVKELFLYREDYQYEGYDVWELSEIPDYS